MLQFIISFSHLNIQSIRLLRLARRGRINSLQILKTLSTGWLFQISQIFYVFLCVHFILIRKAIVNASISLVYACLVQSSCISCTVSSCSWTNKVSDWLIDWTVADVADARNTYSLKSLILYRNALHNVIPLYMDVTNVTQLAIRRSTIINQRRSRLWLTMTHKLRCK